jgi:Aldolase/RraA
MCPVQCGGVAVDPGDIVRADASGVVVIPRIHAPAILERTRAVTHREKTRVQAIAAGSTMASLLNVDDMIEIGRRAAEETPSADPWHSAERVHHRLGVLPVVVQVERDAKPSGAHGSDDAGVTQASLCIRDVEADDRRVRQR